MVRLLVVSDRYPADLTHGRYLRVYHLCRELGRRYECVLVDFDGLGDAADPGIFVNRLSISPRPKKEDRSVRRLFRGSNARYLELSSPHWLKDARAKIAAFARDQNARAVMCFASPVAEVITGLDLPCALDCPDSPTLTNRRRLKSRARPRLLASQLAGALQAWRQRRREADLVSWFDITFTVGEPDRRTMLEVARVRPERVLVVPNGVAESAREAWRSPPSRPRTVVFWGNLDFPPNASAVRWFHERVWSPFLAGRGVEWHIAGANAPPDIQSLDKQSGIMLHGFVDDLFTFASEQGLMINPMVEGSGLKNKVLEAFAMGLPVVSTALGVEAVGARDGVHCRVADKPGDFAEIILDLLADVHQSRQMIETARSLVDDRFTWEVAGNALHAALDMVIGRHERAA